MEENLDPTILVITDLRRDYPKIFKEFFGKNFMLQFCLTHLNKLVVRDFPKYATMEQEFTKYRMLNVFYNRDREI